MLGCNKTNPEMPQRGINLAWLFLDYPTPSIGVYTRLPFTQSSFNAYHIIPPRVKTLTLMVQNEVAKAIPGPTIELEDKHKDVPLKSYQPKSKKDKIKNPYLRNSFHKTDTRHYQRK
jgi:hypothetical protein